MTNPWAPVKAFQGKSFEQNSKETNNSTPKTITLEEYRQDPLKALDDAGVCGRVDVVENNKLVMSIDRSPLQEIVLPPSEIEVKIPVQKAERKKKPTKRRKK